MSLKIPRPVDPSLHPLVTGNYRLATPAIEAFYDLVTRCLRYRIMGALIYGPSRVGKTRAIEYVRLLLARQYPKITTYHAQCEHKPRHAEGPFFATLLEAVGDHAPNAGTSSAKRSRLSLRIREAAARSGSNAVLMFLDEAQRFNENEYEWLRDVHDVLDRQQIKLFTFLVGQEELLTQKTPLQLGGKTQIVARLMVES
jgi:predicted AAA+ superfamily ATPase